MANPFISDGKTGDLKGIRVFKYKYDTRLYLLAYNFKEEQLILTFIEYGAYENFYRDLKHLDFKVIK